MFNRKQLNRLPANNPDRNQPAQHQPEEPTAAKPVEETSTAKRSGGAGLSRLNQCLINPNTLNAYNQSHKPLKTNLHFFTYFYPATVNPINSKPTSVKKMKEILSYFISVPDK